MASKNLTLLTKSDVLLAENAVEKLLDLRDERAIRLYLYLSKTGGSFDAFAASARLGISVDQVSGALDILTRTGLVADGAERIPERADTMPEFAASDVTRTMAEDKPFAGLVEFAEQKIGKMLSTVDMKTLLGIYSWIGLPIEVICLIITSCIKETREKYGENRRTTMKTIENRARLWSNLGISTVQQAEEYLREQEIRGTRLASLARELHLTGRALSPTENRYLTAWIDADFKDELIMEAYDLTVVKTGGLKWRYMDTILQSWKEKGFKTREQVIAGERKPEKAQTIAKMGKDEIESMRRLRELNKEWGSDDSGV